MHPYIKDLISIFLTEFGKKIQCNQLTLVGFNSN